MASGHFAPAVIDGAPRQSTRRPAWLPAPLLPALLLAGCAAQAPSAPDLAQAREAQWAASGAGLLADGTAPLETPESLLHITDEMRAFAVAAVRRGHTESTRVEALAMALNSAHGLHMEYDSEATLTPEEAFRQRRANCLSYTLLFVALARSQGIDARFNEVDVPPVWDLGDERISLLYRHINARVDRPGLPTPVVDVSDEYDPYYPQRTVSDAVAEAQYYNNRSVDLRIARQPLQALRYEARALQLAPQAAYLWTNLAALYLQMDQPRAARVAIDQALRLDDADPLAYDTAANVYQGAGEPQLAARYREMGEDFRDRNPYYHYQLGLAALRGGNAARAQQELAQAIELYGSDARFHFLMALALSDLGETRKANRALDTAIALAPTEAQQERYKSKFARLAKQG